MTHHAAPGPIEGPAPPEPSFAERARTLVHLARVGMLSTLSRRQPGHPFGSVMPYAPDAAGRPLLLISAMAMHTQNLQAEPRASLLVTQPGWEDDPLAGARVTLVGRAAALGGSDVAMARAGYLARHAQAAHWVDFEDFGFWRLDVSDLYLVGGFGSMSWVAEADYAAARPDPLADAEAGVVAHMNQDHADALRRLAHRHGGEEVEEATMLAVDRLGFKLRLRRGDRLWSVRIPFPAEVTTSEATRAAFIAMLAEARR